MFGFELMLQDVILSIAGITTLTNLVFSPNKWCVLCPPTFACSLLVAVGGRLHVADNSQILTLTAGSCVSDPKLYICGKVKVGG